MLSPETRKLLLAYQRDEITEHRIYLRLAGMQKSPENRHVLERIAEDEKRHYEQWKGYTGADVPPDWLKVWTYGRICRIFGLTFGVKLMERGEASARQSYGTLPTEVREAGTIAREEGVHEDALLAMLDEEHLRYIGSIVLGLNDALVELTGALAGLTLALQNTKLIALTGSITGIAAAFSMAASEYLSTKTEGTGQSPFKAALYTGAAYVLTVILLILPYLFIPSFYAALACTMATAISIIALFNYYISVAKGQPFMKRFAEMAGLSISVAAFSFLVGFALRALLGIDA